MIRGFVQGLVRGEEVEPVEGKFTGGPRTKAFKAACTVGWTAYIALRNGYEVSLTATQEAA